MYDWTRVCGAALRPPFPSYGTMQSGHVSRDPWATGQRIYGLGLEFPALTHICGPARASVSGTVSSARMDGRFLLVALRRGEVLPPRRTRLFRVTAALPA